MTENDFLQAIIDDPASAAATWLVLADWLEERGDPRFELVRLQHDPAHRTRLSPLARDERIRALLASGMAPVVPTVTNSIGMKFALIPAGRFLMGSPPEEGHKDEEPQHPVEITARYFLGIYPVTQEEYEQVIGKIPSCFAPGGNLAERVAGLDSRRFPVENISWNDAQRFCKLLARLPEEKGRGRHYWLPTEAQWEFACRGGAFTVQPFHLGKSLFSTQANFDGDCPYGGKVCGPNLRRTTTVGSYRPNAWGLFDMHGNVWEWCRDFYDEDHYRTSREKDPSGPFDGDHRSLRGGSWDDEGYWCRSAMRLHRWPDCHNGTIGFRVVLALPQAQP